MNEIKPYKKRESIKENVGEPIAAYTSNKETLAVKTGRRDDIECAISGEELLDRLRSRIKTLFK